MFIKQFYLSCLAHASYIVVDERTGRAVVIDPQRDVEQYLAEAEAHGATIEAVLLTHFHADFVAGHLELRDRVGAKIHLGARAEAEYDFVALADEDVLEFGDVRLRILETPGHTPEAISIVAYDLAKSDTTPEAVFTGDTLFVGDVGRPDLLASIGVTADELSSWLYDSLRDKLMALPDSTTVYPAHGAGSMCGKNLSKETFSTIGEQRRSNYALQPMTKEAFQAMVTAEQPTAPAYFVHDAVLNRKERATLEATLERTVAPLDLDAACELQRDGAIVVDARDAAAFASGHLEGSLNIGLGGKYATWAGTVLSADTPVVLVAEPGAEREAAMRLGRIGFDQVRGFLDGGIDALPKDDPRRVRTDRVTALDLAGRLQGEDAPLVLDVRNAREWEGGHVEGALNVPLPQLAERIDEVPRDRELAVMCLSGYRSSLASSLLKRAGVTNLVDAVGGIDAWIANELPTTEPMTPACDA